MKNFLFLLAMSKRGKRERNTETSKTQQRTAEEPTALIAFCEGMKKAEDANRRLCIGFKSLERRNEHFQAWRYSSKKENELMEQLEAINDQVRRRPPETGAFSIVPAIPAPRVV